MNEESTLKEAFDPDAFRAAGHRAVDLLADHLRTALSAGHDQVIPWLTPDEAAAKWTEDRRFDTPEALFAEVLRDCIRLHDPRFMGHQISPPAPMASLAGLIVDVLNNGMGVYEMGMAGTAMERAVLRLLAKQFRMPESAEGFLTSGGTLGNLTALLAARGAHRAKGEEERPLAIMVSEEAHYCIKRAAHVMGWGEDGVILIPSDDRFRMRTDQLHPAHEKARQQGIDIVAVIASACSTSTGSYDDLHAIADFCQAHDIWLHVDGAHGAAAAFSSKYRHLVEGIERADSVVLDLHKMLMTPAIATAVLFRQGSDGYRSFSMQAEYLWARDGVEEWFNLAKRTFECTKSMMVLKFYAMLTLHGPELFDANVTRLIDLGKQFAEMIKARPRFELAVEPMANIVCFRHRDKDNAKVRQAIIERGELYLVQTNLRGKTWLRTTLSNPFTTEREMAQLLDAVEEQTTT